MSLNNECPRQRKHKKLLKTPLKASTVKLCYYMWCGNNILKLAKCFWINITGQGSSLAVKSSIRIAGYSRIRGADHILVLNDRRFILDINRSDINKLTNSWVICACLSFSIDTWVTCGVTLGNSCFVVQSSKCCPLLSSDLESLVEFFDPFLFLKLDLGIQQSMRASSELL